MSDNHIAKNTPAANRGYGIPGISTRRVRVWALLVLGIVLVLVVQIYIIIVTATAIG